MSSRRSNGEGNIRRRSDGRWEGRYRNGAWQRRSVFGRTKDEASQKLREALTKRDNGIPSAPARETVGSFVDAWLAGTEPSLRPRTFVGYRQLVNDHIRPRLGSIPLSRLQPHHVQRFYRDLLESKRSPKTVLNVHGCLHRALEQAVRWRLIPVNPASLVDRPRVTRREMTALSPEDAAQVLAAAQSDELAALWNLALTTGCRQGELLALKWPQIDLGHARLRVVGALVRAKGKEPVVAEPKTPRSRRPVELSDGAVAALRTHQTAQKAGALAAGRPYERDGFVFTRPDGRPLSVTTVWKRWHRLQLRAGVQPVRFHDARHTAATLLLGRGVHPKVVSEMLGHSTVAITLDTYSHVTPAMHREAARVMDELFPR